MLQTQSIERPAPTEYAPYYGKYIELAHGEDIFELMESQLDEVLALLRSIPETQTDVLHAPYTWTIKQVISHLIDGERIFAYRALRFARGDSIALPGFDENEYAKTAGVERLRLSDLAAEFESVRRSTLSLFRNLPDDAWLRSGVANGNAISVRALAWVIAGHVRHHANIIQKRLGGEH
jgi:hypothetical protein